MPETTTTDTPDAAPVEGAETAPAGEQQTDHTDWKANARTWESRARQNKADLDAATAELNTLRESTLSDAEKAVEQARQESRAETIREMSGRMVRTHLVAGLTARGLSEDDANAEVDDLDLAKFVTESGEVDTVKVNARLQRARTATPGASSLGLGHTPAPRVVPGQAGAAEAARRYPIKK